MKKKVFRRILIGFLSGAVVGNLIAMLIASGSGAFYSPMLVERFGTPTAAIIMQTLLSALIGVAGMGGMSLYDETDLPLAASTSIHYVIVEAAFVTAALLLRWMKTAAEIGIMSAFMFAAFAIIWGIMFVIHKKEVKQLNEINEQKEIHRKDTENEKKE